jgi:pSer/pThr/pTyr-binding forkhead associated (FHA) protein/uncharacterized RDD family membrane protein YckC
VAKLVINPTSGAKKVIPVGETVLSIGRDPSNDLVLSDSMVSRRHAILELREDQYIIRDNNSSNGTVVNGDKLSGEQELRDGDLIAIGSARLLFQIEPETSKSMPTPVPDMTNPAVPLSESSTDEGSKCLSCGVEVSSEDKFCRRCGKPLSMQPAPHNLPTESGPYEEKQPAPAAKSGGPSVKDKPSLERRRGPRPSVSHGEAAGFWIRFVALLVDELILGVPMAIAIGAMVLFTLRGAQSGGEPSIWVFLIPWLAVMGTTVLSILYLIFFWTRRGATPGKMLFSLVIETTDGKSPLQLGQAVIRLVGYVVNFGVGFLLVAFSEDKRGLHDRLADTRVVKRR